MISTMQAFLITAAKENKTQEVKISSRIEQTFKIKAIDLDEWEQIQRLSTNAGGGGERVSSIGLLKRTAIAGCVDPDFKSAEFIAACGVHTAEEALNFALTAGEIVTLGNKILKISGFAESVEEARAEAMD